MGIPNVILIAPYLGPNSIGPRAVRARELASRLGAEGYGVQAVTVDDGQASGLGELATVLAMAPGPLMDGTVRGGSDKLRAVRSRLVAIGQFALPVPDPHGIWAARLARAGELRECPAGASCIYAIGAPYSALALGAVLARRWGLPLIADLGDPWPDRGPGLRLLERRTMAALDALIVTNERTADLFRPLLAPSMPIEIAPNGAHPVRRRKRDGLPLFVQLGTLSPLRIDPHPIFTTLGGLADAGEIEFASHGEAWLSLAPGAAGYHHGVVSATRAFELMSEATALVIVGNRNPAQIPSKVYEVISSDVRAMYVSELDVDPGAELIERSGHALVSANTPAAITATARKLIALESSGTRPIPSDAYSWEATTDRLMGVIERFSGHR